MGYNIRGERYIKGKKIGRGGNGDVYKLIKIKDRKAVCKYVLKELKRLDPKRYNRFKKEIEIQNKEIKGVMPIIESNLPKILSNKNKPWYVMPIATPLEDELLKEDHRGEKKIKLMLEVARILKRLHTGTKQYAHRDLKPENLLLLDGKIVISDFGLVKEVDSSGITKDGEKVGPYKTIAPEMLKDASTISDARPADVYSFAKTLWLVVNGIEKHLIGIYSRDDTSLNIEEFDSGYIEELHKLLEISTRREMSRRPEISEVVEILEEWISVIENEKKLKVKKGILALKLAEEKIMADEKIYKNGKAFDFIFILISEGRKLKFENEVFGTIIAEEIEKVGVNLEFKSNGEHFVMKLIKLTKIENELKIEVGHISENELDREVYKPLAERNPIFGIEEDVKWIIGANKEIKVN